jgi:hypothetical protein
MNTASVDPIALAVVGMAAFFTAVVRAPLSHISDSKRAVNGNVRLKIAALIRNLSSA